VVGGGDEERKRRGDSETCVADSSTRLTRPQQKPTREEGWEAQEAAARRRQARSQRQVARQRLVKDMPHVLSSTLTSCHQRAALQDERARSRQGEDGLVGTV